MALSAKEHVLIKMIKEADRWRHYVIVSGAVDGIYHWCLTPSRQVRRVDFSSVNIAQILTFDGVKLPRGIDRKKVFLDVDSSSGRYTSSEIDDAVGRCQLALPSTGPEGGGDSIVPPPPPSRVPDASDIGGHRVTGKTALLPKSPKALVKPAPKKSVAHPEDAKEAGGGAKDDGTAAEWHVLFSTPAHAVGTALDISKVELAKILPYAVFKDSQANVGIAVSCSPVKLPETLRDFQIKTSGHAATRFDGLDDIYRDCDETPKHDKKPKEEELDARILALAFDSAEERFMSVDTAVQQYTEEDFPDWPVEGVRSCFFTCKALRRSSRNFLTQHEDWVSRSGIRKMDRSVHEHFALSRALHFFMTYDQVQCPNLAGIETLIKRRQLIERAHHGSPDAPNYAGASYFMGVRESMDGTIIDPANEKYTADRLHVEYEVGKNARLATQERAHAFAVSESGASSTVTPTPKPPRRPKGGKGDAAAGAQQI